MPLDHLVLFSFLLFCIGAAGVFLRRNLLVVLMSVELMLNAVNLLFAGFSRQLGDHGGHIMVMMIFVVAAVEVGVGMAIVVNMFRRRQTMSLDNFHTMRG
jgi:NADH-quinone oxidoreductase subunit K